MPRSPLARDALAAVREMRGHALRGLSYEEVRAGWMGARREAEVQPGSRAAPGFRGTPMWPIPRSPWVAGRGTRVPAGLDAAMAAGGLEEPDGTEVDGGVPWWRQRPEPRRPAIDAIPFGSGPWRSKVPETDGGGTSSGPSFDHMVDIWGIENELRTASPCAERYSIPPNRRCRGFYDTTCPLRLCLEATTTTDPCADNDRASAATDRLGVDGCSARDEDRLCAAIQAASLMFHELLHAFALVFADAGTSSFVTATDCGSSISTGDRRGHMAENTLRWALLQRFTRASSSIACDCVNPLGGDFMNPTAIGIDGC